MLALSRHITLIMNIDIICTKVDHYALNSFPYTICDFSRMILNQRNKTDVPPPPVFTRARD